MKALSVDFSYFIPLTQEYVDNYFPDEYHEEEKLEYRAWLKCYGRAKKANASLLTNVKVDTSKLYDLRQCIIRQPEKTEILVTYDHYFIDGFIGRNVDEDEDVTIYAFEGDLFSERSYNPYRIVSFDEAMRQEYDLIAISKSDWITPPHLDSYFIDYVINTIAYSKISKYRKQSPIDENRYTEYFKKTLYEHYYK